MQSLQMYRVLRCRTSRLTRGLQASYSNKPAVKEAEPSDSNSEVKEFVRISKIVRKVREKKPQKPPFAKNLMLGIFDTDILNYPELPKEEWTMLENEVEKSIPTLERLRGAKGAPVFSELGREKLLGLQVSQLRGGRELGVMESVRMSEGLAAITSNSTVLQNETLGVQMLNKFGSDGQKQKYLGPLVRGEISSAFCIVEPSDENLDTLGRTAILSRDGRYYILNGKRNYVVGAENADILVVVAQTDAVVKAEVKEEKMSVFVVEKGFGGLTCSRVAGDHPGMELSNVAFEGTAVPVENVVGAVGQGEKMFKAIVPEYRLSVGVVCATILKDLINKSVDHYIQISKESNPMHESELVRSRLGDMASSLYAIESMTYLTAGLLDRYQDQDCELESIMVKLFSSGETLKACRTMLGMLGPEANVPGHWCHALEKEAVCNADFYDSNGNLKTLTAVTGLQFAGQKIGETVRKLRNPLDNAAFIFKKMWTDRKQADDKPTLNLFLNHYFHPSFAEPAKQLEYTVIRMRYATEVALSRNGLEIINKHMDLERLAECLVDIYAMTASLSRASRSYCIGLQHASFEGVLAASFCFDAVQRVRDKLNMVIKGQYFTNEDNHKTTSKRIFKFKGYFPVNALTRNF